MLITLKIQRRLDGTLTAKSDDCPGLYLHGATLIGLKETALKAAPTLLAQNKGLAIASHEIRIALEFVF